MTLDEQSYNLVTLHFLAAAAALAARTWHDEEYCQSLKEAITTCAPRLVRAYSGDNGMEILTAHLGNKISQLHAALADSLPLGLVANDPKLVEAREAAKQATQRYLDHGGYEVVALSRLVAADEEAEMFSWPYIVTAGLGAGVVTGVVSGFTVSREFGIFVGSAVALAVFAGCAVYNTKLEAKNQGKPRDFAALLQHYGHDVEGSPLTREVAKLRTGLAGQGFEDLAQVIQLSSGFDRQLVEYLSKPDAPHRDVRSLLGRGAAPAPAVAA